MFFLVRRISRCVTSTQPDPTLRSPTYIPPDSNFPSCFLRTLSCCSHRPPTCPLGDMSGLPLLPRDPPGMILAMAPIFRPPLAIPQGNRASPGLSHWRHIGGPPILNH